MSAVTASGDPVLERIVRYALGVRYEAVPEGARVAMIEHVVDAIGCAIGAVDEPPAVAARRIAAASTATGKGASALGVPHRTSVGLAAFANTSMVRNLDFNDTYNSKSGGHPNDMVPAFLALAEAHGRSGADMLRGAHVAYEVFGALCDAAVLRDGGWDHGVFIAIATAAGGGALLGVDAAVLANAISLTAVSSVPLRITRSGELSAWKGSATAHSVMNALLMLELACEGLTGPSHPFTGRDGVCQRVTGELELAALGEPVDGRSVVERTSIKWWPVEYAAQAPVELFVGLSAEFAVDDIESVSIAAHRFMHLEIGGGRGDAAEKWDPQTRETADHSLPYLAAVALLDGTVSVDSFTQDRVLDPALRPLMRRIEIHERADAAELDPTRQPVDVRIVLRSGEVIDRHCEYSRGHPTNPTSMDDVERKFTALAKRKLAAETSSMILARLCDLPGAARVDALADALRAVPGS